MVILPDVDLAAILRTGQPPYAIYLNFMLYVHKYAFFMFELTSYNIIIVRRFVSIFTNKIRIVWGHGGTAHTTENGLLTTEIVIQ